MLTNPNGILALSALGCHTDSQGERVPEGRVRGPRRDYTIAHLPIAELWQIRGRSNSNLQSSKNWRQRQYVTTMSKHNNF
jgi:hypothetical protein